MGRVCGQRGEGIIEKRQMIRLPGHGFRMRGPPGHAECPPRPPYPMAPSGPPLCLGSSLRLSRLQFRSPPDTEQGVRLGGKQQEVLEIEESFNETSWGGGRRSWGTGTKGGYTVKAQLDYAPRAVWPERCRGMPGQVLLEAHLCCWARLRELYLPLCLGVCVSAWLSFGTCPHPGCPCVIPNLGLSPNRKRVWILSSQNNNLRKHFARSRNPKSEILCASLKLKVLGTMA